MSFIIESLVRNREASEAKSYIIGLERGRIWAEDCADYFDMRRWCDMPDADFALPEGEETHLRSLRVKTPLETDAYVRGWREGVREIRRQY